MRLAPEQIEKISKMIFGNLRHKGLLTFKADEEIVLKRIIEVFTGDMKAEDDLDREVENIMLQYQDEIDKGRMDYRKMFSMIKNRLVKERDIVL